VNSRPTIFYIWDYFMERTRRVLTASNSFVAAAGAGRLAPRQVPATGRIRIGRERIYRLCVSTLSLVLFFSPAHATYNTNLVGVVTSLMTYPAGYVLFMLNNQPTSNGSCNATYFELDVSNAADENAFNRVYARLAMAYATGEQVNVGFDNSASCGAGGFIQVYRIG
jgi:hypothetical protein